MAPELLKSDDAGGAPQKPSKESDVYSFGMVAYEVRAAVTSLPLANSRLSRYLHIVHLSDILIRTT